MTMTTGYHDRCLWVLAAILAAGVVGVVGGCARGPNYDSNHDSGQKTKTEHDHDKARRSAPLQPGTSTGRGGPDRPVPVTVARATTHDVPITIDGLGTVAAYQTVSVHSQVEGRLMRVAFREGQSVHRGDLLAEIDPRPFAIQLHQAEAALTRDEAQLHGAERNLQRYAAVSAERLIPQQQTDDQRALVEQLRGTVQADQAQMETARLMLSYARITSPIDGVTGVRQIDPGNVVHVADAGSIVVVAQMDPIAVIFTLPQDDLPRVARMQGQSPRVVEALSREGDQPLATGRLALIDNQINQTTATMRLKAIFPNPARTLWPNQFVRARLLLDVRKGALVVPAVAVQRGPQGDFVYVVGPDDHAEQRPITVDSIEGEQAILARGVATGERVIVEGQSLLRPGARVVLREGARGSDAQSSTDVATSSAAGGGGARGDRPRSVKARVTPPADESNP